MGAPVLNLRHCAHAYGSREHRWVRSTLRILLFIRIAIRTRILTSDSDSACPTIGIRHSKMIVMKILRCMHATDKRQNDNLNSISLQICILTSFSGSACVTMEIRYCRMVEIKIFRFSWKSTFSRKNFHGMRDFSKFEK